MMKKNMVVTVILSIMVFLMAGCGMQESGNAQVSGQKKNVVLIIGNHANASGFNVTDLKEKIKSACLNNGKISIIALDGAPYLVDALDVPKLADGISQKKRDEIAEKQAAQILEIASQAKAKTEEVDTLKALQQAAHQLEGADGEKYLYIADSGLATTGLVNFCELCLETDQSDKLLDVLKDESAIPRLEDVDVAWFGMCQVSEPQAELFEKQRENLIQTWTRILQESGAKDISIDSSLALENAVDGELPPVSVVPINRPVALVGSGEIRFSSSEARETVWECGEEEIAFRPGSAKLLSSEKKVLKVLRCFIDDLIENPKRSILLAGTTASAGTKQELLDLSLRRTSTIRKLFLKNGVKKSQIKIVGLGFDNKYTIKDTDQSGMFIEEKGKQNRKVLIMNADSQAAKRILKK